MMYNMAAFLQQRATRLCARTFSSAPSGMYTEQLQRLWARNTVQLVSAARAEHMARKKRDYEDKNHHVNRFMTGLPGPNHYGVQLTSRRKYNRGARGTWGTLRRSITRMAFRR
eukprot:GEMP01128818.1.p1 GENE.GEMP01128818.1~~GEMP01128818.1.p1  ORF type:complete len:113 (+),score=17.95 GEMP01128818.1:159-497(+)